MGDRCNLNFKRECTRTSKLRSKFSFFKRFGLKRSINMMRPLVGDTGKLSYIVLFSWTFV